MSFDRLAAYYRSMETVLAGGLLHRCRTRWLGEVPSARRILLAGEGHGRMLAECVKAFPAAEIWVVDSSAGMLAEARRRTEAVATAPVITYQLADLRTWRHDGEKFDLIVTNFFLDCFTPAELRPVVANLADMAASEANWLLADFAVPAKGWQRWRARAVLALAYAFFHCATGISARRLSEPSAQLEAAGFSLRRRAHFNHGLLRADLWRRTARHSGRVDSELDEPPAFP